MRTGRRGRRPLQDKRLRYRILYLRLNDFATKITAVTFGNEDFTTTSFAINTNTKILSNTSTKILCDGIMTNCMKNKNDLIKKTVGKPTVFCFYITSNPRDSALHLRALAPLRIPRRRCRREQRLLRNHRYRSLLPR